MNNYEESEWWTCRFMIQGIKILEATGTTDRQAALAYEATRRRQVKECVAEKMTPAAARWHLKRNRPRLRRAAKVSATKPSRARKSIAERRVLPGDETRRTIRKTRRHA